MTEQANTIHTNINSQTGQIAPVAEHNEIHTTAVEGKNVPEKDQPSLLAFDGTLLVVAVSFVLFTIIMQKLFYGPLTKIREERSQFIKGIKTEAQTAQEEAEKLSSEYTQKIRTAKKKVSEKTLEAMNEANEEKDKILEEKKQDISKLLEEGRQKIREEKDKTFSSLKENISSYAFEISKKILNEEIPLTGVSSETIDRAINR